LILNHISTHLRETSVEERRGHVYRKKKKAATGGLFSRTTSTDCTTQNNEGEEGQDGEGGRKEKKIASKDEKAFITVGPGN